MLEITHLEKSFAGIPVLQDLNLRAIAGEIVAVVGCNGAGKSTLMRIIANTLPPDDGEIEIAEGKKISFLPEGAPLYPEMTPRSILQFVLGAHGFSKKQSRKRTEVVLNLLALQSVAEQMIQTLSKGFQRRTALGMALAPECDILILDEPFDGFDPLQKHMAVTLLKSISPDKLILISTHSLSDASALATRMVVIEDGQIRADGTPQALLQQARCKTLDEAFRILVGRSS